MKQAPIKMAIVIASAVMLSGCISTLGKVVTAPVKGAAKVADWATTSQDEADRERGRKLRQKEEDLGKLARKRARYVEDCERKGDRDACEKIRDIDAEIEEVQTRPI